jgi:hypothetical protein
LEAAAPIARNFQRLVFPGLLQTEKYARGPCPDNSPETLMSASVPRRMQAAGELAEPGFGYW